MRLTYKWHGFLCVILNLNFFLISYNNLNKYIYKNNIANFFSLFNNKYKYFNIFFLNHPRILKYNWAKNKTNLIQYFNISFGNKFNFRLPLKYDNTLIKINEIIFLKRKSGFLKKNPDYEFTILNRANANKNKLLFNRNFNKKPPKLKSKKLIIPKSSFKNISFNVKTLKSKKYNFSQKTMDFKKKFVLILKKNRNLLRSFLKIKPKRKFNFNKYIKNLSKSNYKGFLYFYEYNIVNILVRSNFFFNHKDCSWFLKNGYISLNGKVLISEKTVLKPLEIVNVSYSNYFYFYYRKNLNDCLNNLYRFNKKIWKINQKKKNYLVKNTEKYSNWIYRSIYIKNDIPVFIEVDYISMTLVMLNYTFNVNYVDYYNLKFLNLYLNRLYNWKFVI